MSEYRKKLIEVALPLEAINAASAKEKSIRHGHPSTLHLWWARRPLAACRAVLFGQFVDDPSSWPELYPTEAEQDRERQRLFRIIEELVVWENSNNETVINAARLEIARSVARNRRADGEGTERDDEILAGNVAPTAVNRYLAEIAPPVHDPFAGGGSIPLEAQRLGLRAIATDLNPVAVLINKALIEIPPKFSGMPPVNQDSHRNAGMRTWKGVEGLAEDVRYYGRWLRDEAFKRVGHLYPPVRVTEEAAAGRADLTADVGKEVNVVAWIWARTVASPNPACAGAHVPLVSTFWLSKKDGKAAWVEPVVDRARGEWSFVVRTGNPLNPKALDVGTKTAKAEDFKCLITSVPVPRSYIRTEGKEGRLGTRLMAVVVDAKQGRSFLTATPEMERQAVSLASDPIVMEARQNHLSGSLPNRAMITGGVCSAYGLATWGELFTSRQILMLSTYSILLGDLRARVVRDALEIGLGDDLAAAYGDAVVVYISFAFDKLLDTNTSLCTWQNLPPRLRSTFGRQGFPMTWDFAESNAFGGASGDFEWCVQTQAEALERLPASGGGRVQQADAAKEQVASGVLVSTDPPYYDNIGYAELSDFFYVWLRRNLRAVAPELTRTVLVPKAEELVATPFRFGGDKAAAQKFFEDGLHYSFVNAHSATVRNAPTTVFYAFKQTEGRASVETVASTGWETMLTGLLAASFEICGTWPLRTELHTRNISRDTNALATSIVLVCRPRPQSARAITRSDFRRLLRQELPKAVKALQKGNIAPVDMAQASIGPGMAIFSSHSKVMEADGSAMSVRTALQLINEALDEYLAEQTGEFGPDTRFAVTWFETRGFETGPYGEAETLAKARNVSVQGVVEAGVIKAAAGKVRLLKRSELPDDWEPETDDRLTVWECTQHLIKRLEGKGESLAADLLSRLGERADPARDLAYRLYQTCERKGWAEEARAYNGLVVAWPELSRLAAQAKSAEPAQGKLFE